MTDEELIARLRDKNCCESPSCNCDAAADRIEALVKERDEALEWLSASQGYIFDAVYALDKQEKAEAKLAAMEAIATQWKARAERLEGLTGALRKAEQDFYEAANRFQDEDYEGPHEKFTVNVVCHIKPYFDMNMKHLRDSAAAARAALSATTEEGHE